MWRPVITAALVFFSTGGCDELADDGSGERALAHAEEHQPSAVDVGDPFLADLDHVWIGALGSGHAVVGYDAGHEEIGRISVYAIDSNSIRITHSYPRPCDDSRSEQACADVWDIVVSIAGEPGDHRADIHQTLPGALFSQRQTALLALVDPSDPSDTAGSPLLCTFGVLASGAACFATPPPWVVGTCPAAVLGAVCACREVLEGRARDLDLDAACGKK